MDQNPKIGKNVYTHKPWPGVDYTHIPHGHNWLAGWPREMFKLSIDGESL